uniref:Uncharacterized protein n=1 Tax=Globodera rostochiensis TaxID=31243 RepID=A0A914ICH2_GLORO
MQRSKISDNFTKIETASKELPKLTESENKNIGKFSKKEENIFPKKMITYGGVVTPPGFFKIVVTDERKIKSAQCARLLENVMRDIPQKTGSNLEEFSECFKHFYTAQTNVDGEFEMQLPNSVQETIFVQILPLDKNKRLIQSSIEPTFFLQNVMKKTNWKNGNKDALYFYYNAIIEGKIDTMLSRWASQNYQPSEDEAFLLKAYFREVTEKLVELFTNGRIMQDDELNILYNYGNWLLKCQSEGKLEKTLAQIDGMQMLIKYQKNQNLLCLMLEQFLKRLPKLMENSKRFPKPMKLASKRLFKKLQEKPVYSTALKRLPKLMENSKRFPKPMKLASKRLCKKLQEELAYSTACYHPEKMHFSSTQSPL